MQAYASLGNHPWQLGRAQRPPACLEGRYLPSKQGANLHRTERGAISKQASSYRSRSAYD